MLLYIPIYILLGVSLLFSVGSNITNKFYNRSAGGDKQSIWFFNTFLSLACLVFVVLYSIDPMADDPWAKLCDMSLPSIGMGLLFGVLALVQIFTFMYAIDIGPFSYTSVIVSLSTLISALSGLFWGEKIDGFQIFGMGIMVCSIIFSTDRSKKDQKKASVRWLVVSLISCVAHGSIGVMQKAHQTSAYRAESTVFLVAAFAFMTLVSLVAWQVQRHKAKEVRFAPCPKHYILAALAGALLAVPHVANLYLAGKMPSAIFFPICNTGSLVITLIVATIVFKEKLSKCQWLGIVLGVLSGLFVSGTVSAWLLG